MFTGLIRQQGSISGNSGNLLAVSVADPSFLSDMVTGDSIAVNGVCLTMTAIEGPGFSASISSETAAVTTLQSLKKGSPVNLEKPLQAGGYLHGHVVQGHVDCVGVVEESVPSGTGRLLRVRVSSDAARYIVKKGSVAVDGVSLTVAVKRGIVFEAALVSETIQRTTLGRAAPGTRVNVETDIFGRYVEAIAAGREK